MVPIAVPASYLQLSFLDDGGAAEDNTDGDSCHDCQVGIGLGHKLFLGAPRGGSVADIRCWYLSNEDCA